MRRWRVRDEAGIASRDGAGGCRTRAVSASAIRRSRSDATNSGRAVAGGTARRSATTSSRSA